jgi:hypothetical protein
MLASLPRQRGQCAFNCCADHDDLVLAAALACWTLENAPRGRLQIYT